MRLPKYIRERSGTYHYQRDYPVSIRHLIGRKTFTYPLGLSVKNASELELKKKAIEADEAFERAKTLVTNSDPDAMQESELDKAATDLLRKRGLKPGQFVKFRKDISLTAEEEEKKTQLQLHEGDYVDIYIPELDDIRIKYHRGQQLNAQERVLVRAAQKLANKVKAKPPTLCRLWDEYVEHRNIDQNTRAGQKAFSYWL